MRVENSNIIEEENEKQTTWGRNDCVTLEFARLELKGMTRNRNSDFGFRPTCSDSFAILLTRFGQLT